MTEDKKWMTLSLVSVALALAVWISVGQLTGGEAWDSNVFWSIGYPIEVVACGYFAYLLPRKPWLWGAVMMGSQFLLSFIENFYQAYIPALTLAVFIVLSVPCIIVGYLGARVSKVRHKVLKK